MRQPPRTDNTPYTHTVTISNTTHPDVSHHTSEAAAALFTQYARQFHPASAVFTTHQAPQTAAHTTKEDKHYKRKTLTRSLARAKQNREQAQDV